VREIVKKLDIFREYASDIFQAGDFNTSMVVLAPVVDAVIENYTNLDDSDGLMRNFFSSVMDLYGDILPSFRLEGERRRFMGQAMDWYMEAEWGLERALRNFLRKETERLKEEKYMVNAIELRLADYKKSLITTGPKYSEEYDYVEERRERLEELMANIKGRA
jgi:hypothetical protein